MRHFGVIEMERGEVVQIGQHIPGVPCQALPNPLAISFPDRKAKRETVYLGMFKAKILVLGPCEVTCFVQKVILSIFLYLWTFQSSLVV